ncbi:DAK2 domain-containing protein [Soehngenia longivitae]|uniref:DAK2 domain-containing protein n=1 Tax=Soehngenia longivitae TaxID=2562294 RepID=A0A4Z0D1H8_9FIRM|nr:DAK2 domain-containing protein [Soehngenia longivitae]TFZ39600.1 DAK2 domain-containing protein [Soehngenia longivitae]
MNIFIDGWKLKAILETSYNYLDKNKEIVNALNVFPVPDGDTGTNMSLTMRSAINNVEKVIENDASKVIQAASQGSLMGARGNSGVILSQLFRGFSIGVNDKKEIDAQTIALAMKKASETAYKAVMKPTEGTILTIARECGEYAMEICESVNDINELIELVIVHGNKVLEKTPDMLPVLKQANVVDAGGKGLLMLMEGALEFLLGDVTTIVEKSMSSPTVQNISLKRQRIDTDDIKFGYCTEFIIVTNHQDIDGFRDKLSFYGDSLLVVGADGIIKVHIHTNNPGEVLEKALQLGELRDIKIDNMRYQHEEILLKDELRKIEVDRGEPEKKYYVISVSTGEGLNELFKSLNVDYIITGGQTMNPSIEDILRAIEKSNAKNIIILPNNSNILLAAEQAKNVSNRNVYIVPSKNIAQGISAMVAFDPDKELNENINNMNSAISKVISAQVTYSVRDTQLNGKIIKKGNIIGVTDKDILVVGEDINEVSEKLIEKLINDDISVLTIIYGEDVDKNRAEDLIKRLETKFDELEIDLVEGNQPIYYYIFSLE